MDLLNEQLREFHNYSMKSVNSYPFSNILQSLLKYVRVRV